VQSVIERDIMKYGSQKKHFICTDGIHSNRTSLKTYGKGRTAVLIHASLCNCQAYLLAWIKTAVLALP